MDCEKAFNMEFSVLISIYHKENPVHFELALKSILHQSCLPAEIVIVKDGPLNKELDNIINNSKRKFPNLFKIVELSSNQGLGRALQAGLLQCSCDLVARMDTDDIAKPQRFEKQIQRFIVDPELDIVGSYIEEFDGDYENIVAIRKVPLQSKEIYKFAKMRNPFNHMTIMFKKQSVLDAGNYQHCLWFEDYYLWARMILNQSKMANIEESLVLVRGGKSLFKRRGGFNYLIEEYRLQQNFRKLNFITRSQFINNMVIRGIARIMPSIIRTFFYQRMMRTTSI